MVQRHLDREYNRHFLLFTCRDGRVLSSRDVNWKDIELDAIEILTLSIRGKVFSINRRDYVGFLEFVHFRTDSIKHPFIDGVYVPTTDRTWAIGWTDGDREYCWIFDFATGHLLEQREYERNIALFESHFHPQSRTGGMFVQIGN